MQNVLERMEAIGAERKMADFNVKMKMDYEFKRIMPIFGRGNFIMSAVPEG